MRVVCVLIAAVTIVAFSQTPVPPGAGGPAANRPAISSSVRLEDWALFRSAASGILGWKAGAPARAFRQLTFSEAAARIDAAGFAAIEGFSGQKFSAEIPKNLDYRLTANELDAVRDRLRALNMRMPAYATPAIGPDETSARQLFQFAKSMNVETIISSPDLASLPLIDNLAGEYGVNVALSNSGQNPKSLVTLLDARSKRVGVAVDTGAWLKEGIKPAEGLGILKDRVLIVTVSPAAAGLPDFLRELYRLQIKPSFIAVDSTAAKDFESFDKALHPVITDRVSELARTSAIRGPDRLTPEERQKIEAALPQHASVKPKKPRKLLVMDLNVAYGGHRSIPHANLALELMGKKTGAYEPVFSNDLDNLKYGKIKQFDAVYLNNTVGMVFVDPEVRDGLTRFVREGGGLAGNHGVSHASMDWPEFGEMIGTKWGVHREATEQATIRIDDPHHPLTAAFAGKEFVYQDEYFRFPIGPYSRDKQRVLLSIDVEKTDMNQGRPCAKPCVRPDQDYAVSWIKNYGKGRVFFCILGHNPTLYMTPPLAEYFLAGIQFILGDLDADATPNAKLTTAAAPSK